MRKLQNHLKKIKRWLSKRSLRAEIVTEEAKVPFKCPFNAQLKLYDRIVDDILTPDSSSSSESVSGH